MGYGVFSYFPILKVRGQCRILSSTYLSYESWGTACINEGLRMRYSHVINFRNMAARV